MGSKQLTFSEMVRNQNYMRLDSSQLSEMQWKVFNVIEDMHPTPVCDKEIAERLKVPVNCVTGRRWELVNVLHLVEAAGECYFPDHNGIMRLCTTWRLA